MKRLKRSRPEFHIATMDLGGRFRFSEAIDWCAAHRSGGRYTFQIMTSHWSVSGGLIKCVFGFERLADHTLFVLTWCD